MSVPLTNAQLDELRKFTTPTICNAIEMFKVRRRNEGFMLPEIVCRFPDLGPMVGYVATATHCAREPPRPDEGVDTNAYYEHVLAQLKPRILVAQDLDNPPLGALFGEVNASVHKALGCVGHITNGGVRDLDECHRIGFQYFSGCVQVSHAHVRVADFGKPVKVGGVTVHPGDLIHADKHGVSLIPHSVAAELASACRAMEALEWPLIELARSKEFTPARLAAARAAMREQFERESERFSKT